MNQIIKKQKLFIAKNYKKFSWIIYYNDKY